jgi:DNA gyrase subunit A
MATRDEDFITSLFVANTHAPMLFFSSTGMAYKLKVWRLPEARISGKGKAMVNLLPLAEGERITTILALPENESEWDKLNVVFATKSGDVRRNQLSDFAQVNKSGKIAMKLAGRQGDPLSGQRCAGLQGARFHRCARHQIGGRR